MTYAERKGYNKLAKFSSSNEFNSHFEQAMILHKSKFTRSEYIALNKLRKFANEYVGVAWCKIQTAVSGTHQNGLFGVSRSSFERMLRKAKKLNLITVIHEKRKNKWQTHNVFVFNRVDELHVEAVGIVSKTNTIDVPEGVKIDGARTNNLSELPKLEYTYSQAKTFAGKNVDELLLEKDEEPTPYQKLKAFLLNFVDDKKLAYKLFGIWLAQTSKMINKPSFELAMKAARATIRAIRKAKETGKAIASITGYYNNALSRIIDKWLEEEMRRYQMDWEAATIEDGETCMPVVEEPNKEGHYPAIPVMNQERIERATSYLAQKEDDLVMDGTEKALRRKLRLLRYDELLSEYVFAYSSSLLTESHILPTTPGFYNWLED